MFTFKRGIIRLKQRVGWDVNQEMALNSNDFQIFFALEMVKMSKNVTILLGRCKLHILKHVYSLQ